MFVTQARPPGCYDRPTAEPDTLERSGQVAPVTDDTGDPLGSLSIVRSSDPKRVLRSGRVPRHRGGSGSRRSGSRRSGRSRPCRSRPGRSGPLRFDPVSPPPVFPHGRFYRRVRVTVVPLPEERFLALLDRVVGHPTVLRRRDVADSPDLSPPRARSGAARFHATNPLVQPLRGRLRVELLEVSPSAGVLARLILAGCCRCPPVIGLNLALPFDRAHRKDL